MKLPKTRIKSFITFDFDGQVIKNRYRAEVKFLWWWKPLPVRHVDGPCGDTYIDYLAETLEEAQKAVDNYIQMFKTQQSTTKVEYYEYP